MKKQKNKFKLTPERDKEIKAICANLPAIVRCDHNMKPLTRSVPGRVKKWADLTPEEQSIRKQFRHVKGVGQVENEFSTATVENVLYNHYSELTTRYQQFGEEGVEQYVNWVNEINMTTQAEKIKNAIETDPDEKE